MPDWYPVVRAARYLGVAPWILAEQPIGWQRVALIAEAAELEAQDALQKQAQDAASVG